MNKNMAMILTTLFLLTSMPNLIYATNARCIDVSNITSRIINEDNVDMKSGPNKNFSSVTKLNKGTPVEIISFENGWYRIKTQANSGYVKSKHVTYRKVLFLDWFENGQSLLFRDDFALNLNYKFIVEDVETGKKFEMLRTGGINHADVEPVTAYDSIIIKSIWNGYNWRRRPIFIHLNGNVYAASMSGMPHAGLDSEATRQYTDLNRSNNYGAGINYDSIKNNSVDGHLDIHLLNSRTHTTNKVDAEHQNNIKHLMNFYDIYNKK